MELWEINLLNNEVSKSNLVIESYNSLSITVNVEDMEWLSYSVKELSEINGAVSNRSLDYFNFIQT